MNNKSYDFASQNLIGKQGEAILDQWLGSIYEILDVSHIKKYQETGIDRILTRPDGSQIKVEYKFDLASAKTGNIFFETVSVDNKGIPGWGWSSQADYWIFLLPTKEVLVIEPSKFRLLIWQLRNQESEKKINNNHYNTLGIPISIKLVKQICCYYKQL